MTNLDRRGKESHFQKKEVEDGRWAGLKTYRRACKRGTPALFAREPGRRGDQASAKNNNGIGSMLGSAEATARLARCARRSRHGQSPSRERHRKTTGMTSTAEYRLRMGGARTKRNPNGKGRPLSRCSVNLDGSPPEQRPLSNAKKPERFGVGDLPLGNPSSIVADLQAKVIFDLLQTDLNFIGVSVPNNICEGLLKNAKHRRRAVSVERDLLRPGGELTLQPCPVFKLLDLPFHGRRESQIVEHHRPHLGGDSSNVPDGGIHQLGHRLGPLPEQFFFSGQLFLQPSQFHF